MDGFSELVALSHEPVIRDLLEMAKVYRRATETAECRLHEDEACPAPRDPAECSWAATKFCAARLRQERVFAAQLEAETTKRAQSETAGALGIPKWLWGVLGITARRTIRQTEAVRFVEHAAGSRQRLTIVLGPDGTGKTVAGALWCWLTGSWYYRATNLRWFTRGGFYREPSDLRIIGASGVAIVGLDKPWAAKDGAHKQSLVHVTHERLDAGRRTLITSNMGPTEFQTVIGSNLWNTAKRSGGIATVIEQADGQQQEEEDF